MLCIRFPPSLCNVEVPRHTERDVERSHEAVRFGWNRFGPMFAGELRRRCVERMRASRQRHFDEIFEKINGELRHGACSTLRKRPVGGQDQAKYR